MRELTIFIFITLFMFAGCSDDKGTESKNSGDHVWKEQTQVIDKARDAEKLLEDATEQQRKIINEQTD